MIGIITEDQIINLYKLWLEEKGKHENRPFRYPKDYKRNKNMWSIFSKLALFFDGAVIDPRHYIRACIIGINNCKPGHLLSEKGLNAYEKYHNFHYEKPTKNPVEEINKSIDWLLEYCASEKIKYGEYPFYNKGKTRVFIVHLETKQLSPYLIVLHPHYKEIFESLDDQQKVIVYRLIESAYHTVSKDNEMFRKIWLTLKALADIDLNDAPRAE